MPFDVPEKASYEQPIPRNLVAGKPVGLADVARGEAAARLWIDEKDVLGFRGFRPQFLQSVSNAVSA